MGATASLAIGAYSTVSGFIGDRAAASAAERQGAYQADIYGLNASVAEQQAQDAIARGQLAEAHSRQGTRQLAGRQRAVAAAQGLAMTGSIEQLQGETALLGEFDAMTIRNNARREAWGYQVEAQNDRMAASMARMGAANQAAALRARGTSTLLTGGLQAWGDFGDASREVGKRRSSSGVRPKTRGGWGGSV